MANNRLYIVDTETGDSLMVAKSFGEGWDWRVDSDAIENLRKALDADSMTVSGDCATSRSSNRREWQGLTDEEIWSDGSRMGLSEGGIRRFAREIEAKLKEKNT